MKRDDGLVKARALRALRADDRLGAVVRGIDVACSDGVVEVTGAVSYPWQKFYTQHMLEQVPGARLVVNMLLVEPVSRRLDEEIARELWAGYVQDPLLDERDILAEVEECVVYLRGRVPTLLHKRLAGVLAWQQDGVCDVVNDLDVTQTEPDSNEKVAEAITVALEKDPLVRGAAMTVHVGGRGDVILDGVVVRPEQQRAAESDAWCVLGVRSVENRLTVVRPPEAPEESIEQWR